MNKSILKHMAMLVAMFFAAVAFTACSNDDPDGDGDDNNGGGSANVSYNSTLNINGEKWKINKGFYGIAEDDEFEIVFANFDLNKWPYPKDAKFMIVVIPGHFTSVPTGTWTADKYYVTVIAGDLSPEGMETEDYNTYMEGSSRSGELVITKNGSKYEVALENLILQGEHNGNRKTFETSFGYKGGLEKYNGEID